MDEPLQRKKCGVRGMQVSQDFGLGAVRALAPTPERRERVGIRA